MKRTGSHQIESTVLPGLPPLSWCLVVLQDDRQLRLVHGTAVETAPDGFSEGAWAGPFSLEAFRRAEYVVGSGVSTSSSGIEIRLPTHTLERVFAVRRNERLYISNSLPFVLCASGARFRDSYLHYEADLLSFTLGPKQMRRRIPLSKGLTLQQFAFAPVAVGSALSLTQSSFARPREFGDFASYRQHLSALCGSIAQNARDPERLSVYRPLATLSRGYDSPACAVLALECGATAAITFTHARRDFEDLLDDGSEIAEILRLRAVTMDRNDYRRGNGWAEACFLASGGGGEDVVLAARPDMLKNSLLLTGFLGDVVWGFHASPSRSERGRIAAPGGGSIGEFRLHAQFVHLPVPILDLRSHRSIRRISESEEMEPWRIGGEYDRPIPRRIAEEGGIPREMFGQSKKAITVPMYYDGPANDVLGAAALAEFTRFADERAWRVSRESLRIMHRALSVIRKLRERVVSRSARVASLQAITDLAEPTYAERWRRAPDRTLFYPHWSVAQLAGGYWDALGMARGSTEHFDP